MERLLMEQLKKWKNSKRRKPLILWGARQVGKTWLMKEFGKEEFAQVVYVSLYNNKRIEAIFEQDYDVHSVAVGCRACVSGKQGGETGNAVEVL